jgi:WD40 repeat protein/tetratricopeptide (TPR) repeat protein
MHPFEAKAAILLQDSILVRDLEFGDVISELVLPYAPWPQIRWHPDGRILAIAGAQTEGNVESRWNIRYWDWHANKEAGRIDGFKNDGIGFEFNPQGNLLIGNGWEGRLRLWDSQLSQQLLTFPSPTGEFRFSRDGRLLAMRSGLSKVQIWEVANPREYRTMTRDIRLGKAQYEHAAVSDDNRLLAVGTQDGFGVWDLTQGKPLAFIKDEWVTTVRFQPSGHLLTFATNGLTHWPIQCNADSSDSLRIGPPQVMTSLGAPAVMGQSRDARVIAFGMLGQGFAVVMHQDGSTPRMQLRHGDVWRADVSLDGSWVVTSCQHAKGVRIWEARTGKLVRELYPDSESCSAIFDPTGKWLTISAGGKLRLREVGSWTPGPEFGVPVSAWAISPDGSLAAIETGQGVIHLMQVDSGEELARLEDPKEDRVNYITFTHDGTQLVTVTAEGHAIHVWDLLAIRKQLSVMSLDWNQQPFTPAQTLTRIEDRPLRLHVDIGEREDNAAIGRNATIDHLRKLIGINTVITQFQPLNWKAYRQRGRAHAHTPLNETKSAIDDYSMALMLLPDADGNRIDLLNRRASCFSILGEFSKARDDVRAAEQIDRDRGKTIALRVSGPLVDQAARRQTTDFQGSLRLLRAATEIDPGNRMAHNNLAWLLVTGPEKSRDPKEALIHARLAIGEQEMQTNLNTLGIVLCRNERYQEASQVLEKSLAAGDGKTDGFDLLFLSICQHRQGDAKKAQETYDRSVCWLADHSQDLRDPNWKRELTEFQAEAKKVLAEPPGPAQNNKP